MGEDGWEAPSAQHSLSNSAIMLTRPRGRSHKTSSTSAHALSSPRGIGTLSLHTTSAGVCREFKNRLPRSRGEILTFPDTPTTQGLSLWCFNTVGGKILTFPDTPTTQGLSLWCFNTVVPFTPIREVRFRSSLFPGECVCVCVCVLVWRRWIL